MAINLIAKCIYIILEKSIGEVEDNVSFSPTFKYTGRPLCTLSTLLPFSDLSLIISDFDCKVYE